MRKTALCIVIGALSLPASGIDLMPKPFRPARDQVERAAKAVERETKPVLKEVGYELEDAGKSLLRDQNNQQGAKSILLYPALTPIAEDTEVEIVSKEEDKDNDGVKDEEELVKENSLKDEYPNASRYVEHVWNGFKLFSDATDQSNWSREEKRYQSGQWINMTIGNIPEPGSDADRWQQAQSNNNKWRVPMAYPKPAPSAKPQSQPMKPAPEPIIVPRLP
jgi:uncharacterized protein YrzB (UPF0473 family)